MGIVGIIVAALLGLYLAFAGFHIIISIIGWILIVAAVVGLIRLATAGRRTNL